MFNVINYLRERRIDFETTPGWVNIQCPMCRSAITGSNPEKKYLGFNVEGGYFHCWRCGGHSIQDVVMLLERVEFHRACQIVSEYETVATQYLPPSRQEKYSQIPEGGKMQWPSGTLPLQDYHKQYLKGRGFDADYLEWKYGLMGTVPAGPYAARVMVPIYLNGVWVSYQGRDITGKSPMKYKACRKDLELYPHDKMLYNIDNARATAIIMEGVFDVWRFGDGAVATFGTTIDAAQVNMAVKAFRRVFVVFDAELKAQAKAKWLVAQLAAAGLETANVVLSEGDPGGMSQDDIERMREELLE